MLRNPEFASMPQRFASLRRDELIRDQEKIPVITLVDKDLLQRLQDVFGLPRFGAARALYMTGGRDLEAALDYADKHQNDKDFNTSMEIMSPSKFSREAHTPYKPDPKDKKPHPSKEIRDAYKSRLQSEVEKHELKRGVEAISGLGLRTDTPGNLEALLQLRETEAWKEDEKQLLAEREHPVSGGADGS